MKAEDVLFNEILKEDVRMGIEKEVSGKKERKDSKLKQVEKK